MISISNRRLLTLLLLADFLININFMYFYTVSWSGYVKLGIYLLVLFYMNISTGFIFNTTNIKYISAFLCTIAIETVYSAIHYSQGIDLLKSSFGYLVILGVPIIYSYFKLYHCLDDFFEMLVYLVLLMQILLFVQAFLYNNISSNIQFLNELFATSGEAAHIRNDSLRSGQFNKYAYMVYFYCIYKLIKSDKLVSPYLFCVIFTVINEFYVAQTRGSEVVFIITTIVILIVGLWRGGRMKQGVAVGFVTVVVLAVLFSSVISIFVETFIVSDVDTVSIRFEAINYFFNLAKKTPIFGIGLIYPVQGGRLDLWHTLYGPNLIHPYVYSDVGIFGILAEFGLLSIPTYIAFFARITKITFNVYQRKDERYLFLLGCLIYILGTLGTLIITTTEFPLIWAVFEYIESDSSKYSEAVSNA